MRKIILACAAALLTSFLSTAPSAAQSGTVLRPTKIEMPHSTTLPATCAVGEAYVDTDATNGRQHYLCPVANTWVLQTGRREARPTAGDGTALSPWTGWCSSINTTNTTTHFPAGYYDVVGSQCNITVDNVVIQGDGDATVFVASSGAADIFDVTAGTDHVTFRDFKVQGDQPTATGGRAIDTVGNYTVVDNVTIDKMPNACIFSGTNTGLMVRNSRCTAQGTTATGDHYFVLLSDSTWATVTGNITDGTGSSYLVGGLAGGGWIFVLGDSHDAIISNNIINQVENGIRTSLTARGVVISGNRIMNVTTDAIRIHSPASSVTGNTIIAPGHNGISTDGGVSGVWSGNSITGALNKGIYVFNAVAGTSGLTISGNYVTGSVEDGIRVATNGRGTSDINVYGNVVTGGSAGGINISDSGLSGSALSNVRVTGNITRGNASGGLSITPGAASTWTNVLVTENTSTGNTGYGLLVSAATAASTIGVYGNIYSGNTLGAESLSATNWTYLDTLFAGALSGDLTGSVTAGSGKSVVATAGTLRVPNSTSLPGTCTVGDVYFDTDATTGQQFYVCTDDDPDTWTLQGDGGGSIAFNNISGGTNTSATMIVGSGSSLSASGGTITATSILGSGVSGNITGNAAGLTGTLGVAQGGTNTTSYAQGDILYASAPTTLSKLAKSTSADRYLCNTGTSNNPAWCQIGLSTTGSFSGSLAATLGGTGLTSGTSGGINYWSSTTTQASSALLAANGVVIGGGAGVAPATSATTVNAAGSMVVPTGQSIDIEAHATDGGALLLKEGADDGTNTFTLKVPDSGLTASKTVTLVAATGNLPASAVEDSGTADKCAKFNASGVLIAASGDCAAGGGGTGTVTGVGPGCTTGLCYTNATVTSGTVMAVWEGTTSDANQFNLNAPADPTAVYSLNIPDGTASITLPIGTDTLAGKATTDTFTNKTLNAESTGNVLTTVEKLWLPAAGCNNTTASSFWDLPTANAPTPNCVTGTNTQKAYLDFPDVDGAYSAQVTLALPTDWTGAIDARIKWMSAITTGDVLWQVSTICVADAETADPAFNTASTVADTAKGTTNQTNDAAITGITATGCAAGELLHVKIARDRTDGSDTLGASAARLIGVELTLRRAQ